MEWITVAAGEDAAVGVGADRLAGEAASGPHGSGPVGIGDAALGADGFLDGLQ